MANKKIECYINLTKNRGLITKNKAGESVIYFDVIPNYNGQPGKYGETHSLQIYREGQRHYIGNGTERDFGPRPAPAQTPPPAPPATPDLPEDWEM